MAIASQPGKSTILGHANCTHFLEWLHINNVLVQYFWWIWGVWQQAWETTINRGRFVTRKALEKSKLVNDIHFAGSLIPRLEANFAGQTIESDNSKRSEVSTQAWELFRMASGRIFCVRLNFLSYSLRWLTPRHHVLLSLKLWPPSRWSCKAYKLYHSAGLCLPGKSINNTNSSCINRKFNTGYWLA